MSVRKTGRRAVACAWALLLLVCATGLHAATERGFPMIAVIPPEEHRGGPQTFDVAQDARGVLYFANLYGVHTYDGAWWRMIPLPDQQAALTVESNLSLIHI